MNSNALAYAQLKLHVDVPNLEETWLDGYQSGFHDKPEEGNPYPMGTAEYELWTEGWWSGFYQEQPLFSLDGSTAPQVTTAANEVKIEQVVVKKDNATRKYIVRTIEILGALLAAALVYQLADFAM